MLIRKIKTSCLDVEFIEWNPSGRSSIILLHGWPDSFRTWFAIAPYLVEAGYRVLAPSLRGCSGTTFLSAEQPRSGQPGALGRDLIEFALALDLDRPVVVGHDWGARAVAAAVGLEESRFRAMVMISIGYATNYPTARLSIEQAQLYWYHWFMNTPVGEVALTEHRREFARHMWLSWSPTGWFSDGEFYETSKAFDNEDWVEVVLHYYRYRWNLVVGDSRYEDDDLKLRQHPCVSIPGLILHGAEDGVNPPSSSEGKEVYFRGPYLRLVIDQVGHFPQRENPSLTAELILNFLC
ncbi:MAG: alpha/beta fold hydrolase [Burkholderiaceae bacterium]|jgi:pimeloyl-ACP methyl ester carboxylesterase